MTTQTVSADQYRSSLIEQIKARDDYGFCSSVAPYLAVRPGDTYVRLMAVRSYLKLNLVEPAQALVQEGGSECREDAQLLEARSSISAVPGSRLDWASRASVFDANLNALSGRGVDVSLIRDAWARDERRYELYLDSSDQFQVRYLLGEGDWRWYPGLGRHSVIDDTRELPDDIGGQFPGPYLFDGLGLGRYFERVCARSEHSYLDYSCALYVLERDPARLAVAFQLNDWAALLADPRILLFVGEDANRAFSRTLLDDLNLPCPVRVLQTGAVFDKPQSDIANDISRIVETSEQMILESLAVLDSQYAGRDIHYWAKRFEDALRGSGEPLRILASVSRHTTFLKHSVRDAQRAFDSLGHPCTVLTEDTGHTTVGTLSYHNAIREIDPDIFFNLDHLRPEFGVMIPANLPILAWDQDQLPHVITKENLAKIAPYDFIAGCSKHRCLTLGVRASQLLHACVPTCPEQFAGEPLSDDETARFSCDVSFVSHASQTPAAFHQQERSLFTDPAVVALLDTLYKLVPSAVERHRVLDQYAMSEVIAEACRSNGITSLDPALEGRLRNWYLWRLADRIFRHQALEWVGQWARTTGRVFRIYGNGWEDHPTLSGVAAGPVENGRELLCLYRASKINLQLMPAGFIHQRALDGLAAGGFFMSRLVPHDLHGRSFSALDRRMRELGIVDSEALLAHSDVQIKEHLATILGAFVERGNHHAFDLIEWIRSAAECPHPDEAFDGFEKIVFDSAEQFGSRAEFFLENEESRTQSAARMREVVVDRFSYRATMKQFLEAMRDHLVSSATESPGHGADSLS
jgi:hypothetical protein